MPALLTSASIDWKRDSAVSTILAAVAGSPMWPSTRATRSEAATSVDWVTFRELATTLKPRSTNPFTIPAPIPCAAPLTMAVFGRPLIVVYLENVFLLRPVASAHPRQPLLEQPLDEGRQARAVVGVGDALDGFRLRRVGVDGPGQGAQAETAHHGQRQLRDHLTRVPRHHGGAEDAIAPRPDVDLDEAVRVAIEDRPVHMGHRLREVLHVDAVRLRLGLVEPDVGDLRVRVGTPGDDQGAGPGPPEEEGVLEDDAGHGVGGVGELEARADVAGGEDAAIRRLQPVVHLDPLVLVVRHPPPLPGP